jgi:beta-lactamase superfamily II metal-dependent hydrolase
MRIDIFNVGHGQRAVLIAPNGRRMMLDCGDRWGDDHFWTPSLHSCARPSNLLGLMNLDEDHLRDFKNVMQDCTVLWILSNPTVVRNAQEGWYGTRRGSRRGLACPTQKSVVRTAAGFRGRSNPLLLSVLFKILFTGDLEVAGWRRLLTIPAFRQNVQNVSVFVASHHGRESGY